MDTEITKRAPLGQYFLDIDAVFSDCSLVPFLFLSIQEASIITDAIRKADCFKCFILKSFVPQN